MTSIQKSNIIAEFLGVKLFIKRDDLYPILGGGNKARKLDYIMPIAKTNGYNSIVTSGSNQSNHIRATSVYAASLGWKSIIIIHDNKPKLYQGNLKITSLTATELRFVDKINVKQEMDNAMNELKEQGLNPLYIFGGGHCVEGSFAYYEAVKELKDQLGNTKPDFIVVASGTGTTQAGLEIGICQFYPECKVLGVSVARNKKRGKEAILNSMKELNEYLKIPISLPDDIYFDDQWMGNGYEEIYPELIETIRWASKTEGLILDTTYSGKAFHALIKYVENGLIPKNSNVVFWHTGGLLNLMASNKI